MVQAVIETIKLYRKCGYFARSQKKQCGSPEFYFGMAERMLISSLMDGDWMDAATCADQRFDQVLANAKACTDWEPLDQAVDKVFVLLWASSGTFAVTACPAVAGRVFKRSRIKYRAPML